LGVSHVLISIQLCLSDGRSHLSATFTNWTMLDFLKFPGHWIIGLE